MGYDIALSALVVLDCWWLASLLSAAFSSRFHSFIDFTFAFLSVRSIRAGSTFDLRACLWSIPQLTGRDLHGWIVLGYMRSSLRLATIGMSIGFSRRCLGSRLVSMSDMLCTHWAIVSLAFVSNLPISLISLCMDAGSTPLGNQLRGPISYRWG